MLDLNFGNFGNWISRFWKNKTGLGCWRGRYSRQVQVTLPTIALSIFASWRIISRGERCPRPLGTSMSDIALHVVDVFAFKRTEHCLPWRPSITISSEFDWERLFLQRKKQKALTMFKTMNGLASDYLQSLFSQRHSVYNLRDSEGKLTLPKPSTNYLKRSFSYRGAMLWNNLPKCLN